MTFYSVPIEIIKLGLEFEDYEAMSDNIKRVLNMRNRWDSIFERANRELPSWVTGLGLKLPEAMSYDREVFRRTGLDYGRGFPVQGCATVAVADYLLRNRGKLKQTSIDEKFS